MNDSRTNYKDRGRWKALVKAALASTDTKKGKVWNKAAPNDLLTVQCC